MRGGRRAGGRGHALLEGGGAMGARGEGGRWARHAPCVRGWRARSCAGMEVGLCAQGWRARARAQGEGCAPGWRARGAQGEGCALGEQTEGRSQWVSASSPGKWSVNHVAPGIRQSPHVTITVGRGDAGGEKGAAGESCSLHTHRTRTRTARPGGRGRGDERRRGGGEMCGWRRWVSVSHRLCVSRPMGRRR